MQYVKCILGVIEHMSVQANECEKSVYSLKQKKKTNLNKSLGVCSNDKSTFIIQSNRNTNIELSPLHKLT